MTLLKNIDKNLPFGTNEKILVTGPAANSLNILNGAWTHTWQGVEPKYNTQGKATILEALQKQFSMVEYVQGATLFEEVSYDAAVKKARNVDRIVVCLGEMPATEKPGDIDQLELPDAQLNLVKALAKTGKPITLVLVEGRPRVIRDIESLCSGVLLAYLPGDEGGLAVANTLAGINNPSGKLPFTYPRYANSLIPYDHKNMEKIDVNFGMNAFNPQWEFGFGLSYANFEYANLKLKQDTLTKSDSIQISVEVANASDLKGKEVVQVFVTDEYASITPSVQRLRAYQKVELDAGQTKTVQFSIPVSELAFVNRKNIWEVESGAFSLKIKDLSAGFQIK